MPDRKLPDKLPRLYRDAVLEVETREAEGGSSEKVYRLSFSSDKPVDRWWGKEILGHDDGEIDLSYASKGLALLESHLLREHIGIVEGCTFEKGKGRGEARFSKNPRPQEIRQDVDDGIRRHISVGYIVREYKLVESKNGVDTYRATRWTPVEVSIVPVPADISVGIGRSEDPDATAVRFIGVPPQEERSMPPEDDPNTPTRAAGAEPAVVVTRAEGGGAPQPAASSQSRESDAAEIARLCENHNLSGRIAEFLEKRMTISQVKDAILEARKTDARGTPPADQLDGLSDKDRQAFSYHRVMQALANGRDASDLDGLEGDVHRKLQRELPAGVKYNGGILVPMRTGKRTMDSLTAGKGVETVFDQPGELIDILRNTAHVIQNGAQVMTGVQGNVLFPRQEADAVVRWVPENPADDVEDSDLEFGQVLATPHTMMGNIPMSRQLLAQSALNVEGMGRTSLGVGHALAVDLAALHGTGVNGQPLGIYNTTDVQTIAMGGTPTFGKLVDMTGKVADKNAHIGNLAFETTPLMAAKMKQTLEFSAAGALPIWRGTYDLGEMAGYRARATNQVSKVLGAGAEHGVLFGNWATVMLLFWASMEILVNPYSKAKKGIVEFTTFQMADVVLRYPQAFCVSTGATV